ncbi:hypothetical protein ASG56_13040 [Rhodococcus sp. Leaf7]|uniref:hypothetical protein n=1 Tax=unclassified Rhodococcus (in: high G+C Gram-positive bacteria) TaxID=192944 RepID=UPI0006F98784|nr:MULTISPECIES: hypothetical protein [unclassified Rhodococcus (in: high G+C Gram-positive bacteria)]KQU04303.1 hypothetical protein ASG56_13040 [Rhodococcus sp. Leaf7]KQU40488.1 hypothetical protein ASG64_13035 [Rhodococcus sp. Leaf247]
MRTASALLASALAGAVAGIAWSGPRSDVWPFAATVDDLIGWSSTQSTATTVGQLLVVVTVALAAATCLSARITPWALAAVMLVVLAFTKVALPEAASLSVFTALHLLKSCAAGLLIGLVLYATRRSRAGWVALATGLFGGTLLASVGTIATSDSFAASRLDSSSVFGEPAWWLLGAAFVLCVAAAALYRTGVDDSADPSRSELARLVVYAGIVALVCRLCVEFVGTSEYQLWKAITVLVVALLVIDRVAARWEAADARTVIIGVLITASAIAMWNAGARTTIDPRVLTAAGVAGLVVGAAIAWRLPVGRITSWVAAALLTAAPMIAAAVHVDAVTAVALGVVAALVPIALTAVTADPHASVRPLAVSLPGLAILLAAAVPVPTVDFSDLAALVPMDASQLPEEGETGSLSILGYGNLDALADAAKGTTDLTSAYLALAVGVLCTLRIVWLSRRPDSPEPGTA